MSAAELAEAPDDEAGHSAADHQSLFGLCLRGFLVDLSSSSFDVSEFKALQTLNNT